ncbi:MAG: DNA glycosylase [Oscillospiraceae bacterium]|nr:DNA glycosylase [Oscillospiraceae bacterium]
MKYKISGDGITVTDIPCLHMERCLFCGQAFRWRKNPDGSFHGVVNGKITDILQQEDQILFLRTEEKDFLDLWKNYFDMDRDYETICGGFSADENLSKATDEFYGIRILRQDPWEALCSFIISQNNNIPRIAGIIDRFCRTFGKNLGGEDFAFPSAGDLAGITVEELAPLRAGFRAKYIVDAVEKLNGGELSLENIADMPIEEARQELMKIKGVGAKVAECTLLYGFGKDEAFPVDVWVKKIMAEMYPDGLPDCTKGVEGIAQQYLFHWRRNSTQFKT